jgi:NAD(P)-dependent dehydrogenase (short-subunit alcohol dehydrogenase family)
MARRSIVSDVLHEEGETVPAGFGGRSLFQSRDISNRAQVAALVDTAAKRFAGIDATHCDSMSYVNRPAL